MLGTRPYFAHREVIKTALSRPAALERLSAMVAGPAFRGRVAGDEFWFRPRANGAGWYPYATGEVSEHIEQTWIEVSLGMHPLTFTVEAVVIAAALFWEAAALLAMVVNLAGVPVGSSTRPLVGAAVLLLLVAGVIFAHRAGNAASRRMLEEVRAAVLS